METSPRRVVAIALVALVGVGLNAGPAQAAATGTYSDDGLTVAATLDQARGNPQGTLVVDDMDGFLFDFMTGELAVSDDSGPVAGAEVEATVTYHGSSVNPIGIPVEHMEGVTNPSGVFEFAYKHDVGGAADLTSLASLPGYHELHFVVADHDGSQVRDVSFTLKYWVRPDLSDL